MKTIVSTIALVSAMSTAAFAGVQNTFTVDADGSVGIQTVHTLDVVGPSASEGLYLLATTGSGDVRAEEGFGKSYHHTGGKPGAFTYEIDTPWMAAAEALLGEGEFLAPHFLVNWSGDIDIMVAPHLLVDGKVMHGAGPDDSFIRISADRTNVFVSSTSAADLDVAGTATGTTDHNRELDLSASFDVELNGTNGTIGGNFVSVDGEYTFTGAAGATEISPAIANAVAAALNSNGVGEAFGEIVADVSTLASAANENFNTYTSTGGTIVATVTEYTVESGGADLIVSISGAKRFDYSDDIAK